MNFLILWHNYYIIDQNISCKYIEFEISCILFSRCELLSNCVHLTGKQGNDPIGAAHWGLRKDLEMNNYKFHESLISKMRCLL